MGIIPHNDPVRQVALSASSNLTTTRRDFQVINPGDYQDTTPLQRAALELYQLGFNVFPQPIGKKAGLPWKRLQYTRLHPTHPHYGLKPLFSRPCNTAIMCGRTSGNLFIIDCESQETLNYHLREMRKRRIPIWAAKTSRGGHIYLRSAEGEVANIEPGIIQNTEIRGCRSYVLAPPSIHPDGAAYHWLTREGNTPPVISIAEINWLRNTKGIPVSLKLDQPQQHTKPKQRATHNAKHYYPYNPLSRKTQEYLRDGHHIPKGERNNRLFSAACDLAGNQKTLDEVKTLLAPVAQASGLHPSEIERTIQSAFSRPRGPAKPQHTQQAAPKPARTQNWKDARRYIDTIQWQGRYASSNHAVAIALTERARLGTNENGIFRASIREIACIARLSTTTVQNTLKRLQKAEIPLIFRVSSDNTSGATLWRFNEQILKEGHRLKSDSLPPPPPWVSFSVSFFNALDFVEREALGRTGWRLYRFLCEAESSLMPREIAALGRFTVNQVNYGLKKLAFFGLVKRLPAGWKAIILSVEELNQRVSAAAGTLGKGEARKQRFAQERALHVGRILLAALYRFWSANADSLLVEQHGGVDSSVVQSPLPLGTDYPSRPCLKLWRCPNCGQMYFGDDPPDMCAMCRDFTTWQEVPSDPDYESDPLISLVLELGGVVRVVDERCPPPGDWI